MLRKERILVPITSDMLAQAQQTVSFQEQKGKRPSTRQDSANNNLIGDLAHQVVEVCLGRWLVPFTSTRLERYDVNSGDALDIEVHGKRVDIKGTCLPDDHFYVYAQNANNPSKNLDYYLFVRVERDWSEACIYGTVPTADLNKRARLFPAGDRFNHDNYGVPLYAIQPFAEWVEAVDKRHLQ